MAESKVLYVFVDESGDFTFNEKGTDNVLLSAVCTEDPCRSAAALQELKYDLLASQSNDLEFHATVNSKGTRKRVADVINELGETIQVYTVYLDKHLAHPKVQHKVRMMEIMGGAVAMWVCKVLAEDHHERVVLVFDSVLTGKEQDAFKQAVKPRLKATGVPYHLAFHPVKSDLNGQIADYFSWSWFRWVEHQDKGPLGRLSRIQWNRYDLFNQGHTRYW